MADKGDKLAFDPTTIITTIKTAKIGLPNSVKVADKIATDLLKLVHLILAPAQFAAAWQDRLSNYIDRAVRQVPEERRIQPVESIALTTLEKLRLQGESEPVTSLYVNLLARAMDRERVGEAHPAFPFVISQLAPDELIFLLDLARREHTVIMAPMGTRMYPDAEARALGLANFEMPDAIRAMAISETFAYETLSQPEMYPVYQDHLQHLGLIEYSNELQAFQQYLRRKSLQEGHLHLFTLRLTHFGKLFLKACMNLQETASGETTNGH